MLGNLIIVAGQVLTLFLMMAVGYVMRKRDRLSRETTQQLTQILLYIVAPCLIVDSLQIERNAGIVAEMGITALGCIISLTIGGIIVLLLFRKKEPKTRSVLRFGSMYPNSAFMGFPLIRGILGNDAMVFAAIFLIVFQVIHWTHGVAIMVGRDNMSIKKAFFNPGMFGVAVGLIFFVFKVELPWPVSNAVTYIGNINTPIAMFVIGAQMADADLIKLLRVKELYSSAAIKLVVIPALTIAALTGLKALGLAIPPLVFCTVCILSAAPTAGVTAMFAERFERDTLTAARCVSLSTLLSIITLPVFAALAQSLAGL